MKFSTAFSTPIPEEKVSTMSWDDQMSAKESKNLVFRLEIVFQVT